MANLTLADATAAAAFKAAVSRVRVLIVHHLPASHSPDKAAGIIGLSRSSPFQLCARHAAGGIAALYNRPRSSAPKALGAFA